MTITNFLIDNVFDFLLFFRNKYSYNPTYITMFYEEEKNLT